MGPLLSTRLASSALPMADGARCFYANLSCGELVKTAPADAMISMRQSISQSISLPRLVPLPVCRVVWSGRLLLLGGVSFPVIFVYFRLAPELSISSGIMRLCCGFLLACRAGDVIGSAFLFIILLGFLPTRAVPARVMPS